MLKRNISNAAPGKTICPTINTKVAEAAELSYAPHDRTNVTAFAEIASFSVAAIPPLWVEKIQKRCS